MEHPVKIAPSSCLPSLKLTSWTRSQQKNIRVPLLPMDRGLVSHEHKSQHSHSSSLSFPSPYCVYQGELPGHFLTHISLASVQQKVKTPEGRLHKAQINHTQQNLNLCTLNSPSSNQIRNQLGRRNSRLWGYQCQLQFSLYTLSSTN